MTVNESTKTFVRQRASNAYWYCQRHQNDSLLATLHVEHIIPKKHDGSDDEDNLALACIDCNLHKRPNLSGIDPETDQITSLFNPRQQSWDEHVYWDGIYIRGLTDTGRATVRVFNMNSDDQLTLRSS